MRQLISALLIIVFAGCAVSNVSSDYTRSVNTAGLHTYDWSNVSRPLQADPVFVKSFKRAAEAELRARGYTRSSNSPDFVISLHRSVELRRDYINGNYPYGIYGGFRHHHRPFMSAYTEEILYVNCFRAGTKDLIWHAARSGRHVQGLQPADNEKKAAKAATEVMKNFKPATIAKR